MRYALAVVPALLMAACAPPEVSERPEEKAETPRIEFALAVHGGAGVISKDMEEERKQEYFETLRRVLTLGRDRLDRGDASLDVVEDVIRRLEDSPLFNAGKGAVFTHDGENELDAAIMDGRTLGCGSITGVRTVKNPISLARLVMEKSKHVFFSGAGAERFADEMGVERVDPDYFFVQRRYDQLQQALAEEKSEVGERDDQHGTVGAVALDRAGDLAAATSTGGLTNKRYGRIGDVPVIGAGTYANNLSAAVSCTGKGEQFIRNTVARDIAALVEYKGLGVREAAEAVIHGKLDEGDGGAIVVGRDGSIALVFSSPGMFRGAADSTGRFEVAIWE